MESSHSVLVIEDNPVIAESLAICLELWGHHVTTAGEGRSGVEMALREPPDLIICDYWMPDCTGIEVLQQLKDNTRTAAIPFIFFTAYTSAALRGKCLEMGANAYVEKGDEAAVLLDTVKQFLGT